MAQCGGPPPEGVLCVGGAVVDRSYRLSGPLRPATSNPVAGRRGFGGVARNVAENLRHLGVRAGLLSRVGDDEAGRAMVRSLDALGIDRRGILVAPGESTAEYVAVLTPGGDLALGLADMAILDGLTPAVLAGQTPLFAAPRWVFADCNLPAETLLALARRAFGGGYSLAVDAVSVAKSARLPRDLGGIDLLFLNRDEAAALMEGRGLGTIAADAAAMGLLDAGARAVVLTLGSEGALAASAGGCVQVAGVPARPIDVTGAGDALVAAAIRGLMAGCDLIDAVAQGCRAAAHTVESPTAVSPALSSTLGQGRSNMPSVEFHKTVLPSR